MTRVVIFRVGRQLFALPGDEVLELIDPQPVTPLPFVPDYVDGVISHGGRVIAQIGLATRMNLPQESRPGAPEESGLVIVRAGSHDFALRVTSVLQVATVDPDAIATTRQQTTHTNTIGSPEAQHGAGDGNAQDPFTPSAADVGLHVEEISIPGSSAAPRGEPCSDGGPLATFDARPANERPSDLGGPAPSPVIGELRWQEETVLLVCTRSLALEIVPTRLPNGVGVTLGADAEQRAHAAANDPVASFLLFTSSSERYAFRLSEITEVMDIVQITPLPHGPEVVAGVASVRGLPLLALRLRTLLGHPPRKDGAHLIILQRADIRLALLVDTLLGIESFHSSAICPLDEARGAVKSIILDESDRIVGLLEPKVLLDERTLATVRPHIPNVRMQASSAPTPLRRFLHITVGNERCAIAVEAVIRVAEEKHAEALAHGGTTLICGAVELGGTIMPVVDLSEQLGERRSVQHGAFVVVNAAGRDWALRVDRCDRLVDIPAPSIEPAAGSHLPFVGEVGNANGALVSILTLSPLEGGDGHGDGMWFHVDGQA